MSNILKAFDSVPHAPLLQHLKDIRLNSHILRWISSYLWCIKQYVVVEGASSSTTSVPSGVPQGSVLGPLLFLTYINCVADLGFSDGPMYADDILLWKPIKCSSDYVSLQADIDNISNCIRILYLSLNSSKCKYIIASRKRQPTLPSSGLGLDTLCFYFCLLFYSLMLASHAYYAFKVNLLFSYYAPKYLVHKQNVSFSIVLKHDRNRNIR